MCRSPATSCDAGDPDVVSFPLQFATWLFWYFIPSSFCFVVDLLFEGLDHPDRDTQWWVHLPSVAERERKRECWGHCQLTLVVNELVK